MNLVQLCLTTQLAYNGLFACTTARLSEIPYSPASARFDSTVDQAIKESVVAA